MQFFMGAFLESRPQTPEKLFGACGIFSFLTADP